MLAIVRRSLVTFPRKHFEQQLRHKRYLTDKLFLGENLQLWSDGGKNVNQSSSDNIGGWQTGDLSLINSVDVNGVKYESVKGIMKCENEDRIQIMELLPDVLFVGVFDGHGGSFVVDFVSRTLPLYIKRILQQGNCSLTTALRKGFIDCDSSLAKAIDKENNNLLLRSGSTATIALLRNGQELVVASVGDSRAILCSDGNAILLTNDHTPSCKYEKNRILVSGGTVNYDNEMVPRVNGRLTMTRCFGNFDLKPYGVIPVPEMKHVLINQDKDSFLALVTDGISTVMTTNEACNILENSIDPQESVEMLTSCAAQFGTEDDSTAILVPFRLFGQKPDTEQSVSYKQRNAFSKLYTL